ncbi:hypothetical protein LSH36_57g02051 [Paralvinella palmiformis]|uniref:Small-subunit processome Utp12 domain-containing protein n=1 Tax=Paralvinella palmiformis TaxID=53620 RepID=A0AAD9NE50_9ANNE|nr:hypothetical protein LSH36_57g02051 [Paralvinella palmiformis]
MKFSYKFSNLLGTVYRKGNLSFTPDGNTVISPVGNRITLFDLKNNKSETLPIESHFNITAITISPDGNLLIAVNEDGEAMLISLISRTVLHSYHFHRPVNSISFSPDGKKFAVTKENTILVFHAPGCTKEYNPFVLYRTFYGFYDETVCIDWTNDSRAFLVGGKDMNTRVYGAERFKNLIINSLGGHTDSIVAAFFEHDSLDVYSLSRNGQLCIWECDTDLEDLKPFITEDEAEQESSDSSSEEDLSLSDAQKKQEDEARKAMEDTEGKISYKRLKKHNYKESRGEGAPRALVTSAAFHKPTHILITGFEDGAFFLHEMPDFNLIHSLSISDHSITSIAFNKTGDWIALGCSSLGQLLVWEWQSESYVLKQQGHFNNMRSLAYSPDGQYIITGGDDGKVKVWNASSGFCFVTFTEHLAAITDVAFSQNGQVVVSSSLDGTVRAFDLNRYRNFRTFTSPRPAQFSCLTLDHSGDIVCAGGMDLFEIFVWSMQTGRLLEILAGHEGPISSLAFCSSHAILASGSWDHTVRLWDVFESKGAKEVIQLQSDALCVTYKPDGTEIGVATLDGQITFWNVHTANQMGCIEGRPHLGYTRKEMDKITAKKSSFGKAFTTLCYTADGSCVLAAGHSKNVCIFSVADQLLIKKFQITCNLSFDGTEEFLDRRKMTEFGSLALVEERQDDDDGKDISLPGVRKGDMSSRHWKPEVRVFSVSFSPTGRAWAATTTEGLLLYSLDNNLVFDPFDLEIDITPANVKKTLKQKEYATALMLAFLNLLSQSLPDKYIDKMLNFVASQLENTAHVEFYLVWCQAVLMRHTPKLKLRSENLGPVLRNLMKNLKHRYHDLSKLCDHNKYSLQYIISLSQLKRKNLSDSATETERGEDDTVLATADSSEDEQMLMWDSKSS